MASHTRLGKARAKHSTMGFMWNGQMRTTHYSADFALRCSPLGRGCWRGCGRCGCAGAGVFPVVRRRWNLRRRLWRGLESLGRWRDGGRAVRAGCRHGLRPCLRHRGGCGKRCALRTMHRLSAVEVRPGRLSVARLSARQVGCGAAMSIRPVRAVVEVPDVPGAVPRLGRRAAADLLWRSAQRLFEVGAQVGVVFDAHGQAAEAVVDAERGARFRRYAGVCHERRVFDQAFDAAERFGQGE